METLHTPSLKVMILVVHTLAGGCCVVEWLLTHPHKGYVTLHGTRQHQVGSPTPDSIPPLSTLGVFLIPTTKEIH
jgi:hypothetical protein